MKIELVKDFIKVMRKLKLTKQLLVYLFLNQYLKVTNFNFIEKKKLRRR